MAVFKQGPRPEDNYTMIANTVARHPDISLRAKGMYLFVRSHKDGWKLTIENIAKAVGLSKDTVSKDINELIDAGCIVREQGKGERGHFGGVEYLILSEPYPKIQDADTTGGNETNPQVAPNPNLPDTVSPDAVRSSHKKTIPNNTKDKKTKEDPPQPPEGDGALFKPLTFDDEAATPESLFPDRFEQFWKTYPHFNKCTKAQVEKSLKRALKKAEWEVIIDAARKFSESEARKGTEKRYIAQPTTWLNQERWQLEPQEDSKNSQDIGQKHSKVDKLRGLV